MMGRMSEPLTKEELGQALTDLRELLGRVVRDEDPLLYGGMQRLLATFADLERQLAEAREKIEELSSQVAEAVWIEEVRQREHLRLGSSEVGCCSGRVPVLQTALEEARGENKKLKQQRVKARTKEGMVAGSLTASVHTLQEQLAEVRKLAMEAVCPDCLQKMGEACVDEGCNWGRQALAILGEKGA